MQDQVDKDGDQGKSDKPVKQKQVGDETPNPLPDHDYAQKQPAGDDTQANPDSDASVS